LSFHHPFRERRARRAAEVTLAGAIALSVIVAPGLIRGHGSRTNQAGAAATTSSSAPTQSTTSTTVAPVALPPVAPPNPVAPVTVPDEQAFRHRWTVSPTFRLSVAYANATPEEQAALVAYLTPAPPAPPAAPAPKPAPRAVVRATPAPVASAPAPAAPAGSVWDRIAACESGGNWADNTGNGYSGGLQFSPSTWRAYGGTAYAAYAWQASREQQIAVATNIYNAQHSYRAWPVCGRRA
jgi:resuscitation-promoting factor RpfE